MKLWIVSIRLARTKLCSRWKRRVASETAITRSLNIQCNWKWRLWAVATLGTPLNQRSRTPKKCARLMCVWITSILRWRTSAAIRRSSSIGQRCKSERTTSIPVPGRLLADPGPRQADQRDAIAPPGQLAAEQQAMEDRAVDARAGDNLHNVHRLAASNPRLD